MPKEGHLGHVINEEGIYWKYVYENMFKLQRDWKGTNLQAAGASVLPLPGGKIQVLFPATDEEKDQILTVEQDKRVSKAAVEMNGYEISILGDNVFHVQSKKKASSAYEVDLNDNTCSCPDSQFRPQVICKHRVMCMAYVRDMVPLEGPNGG